MTSFPMRSTPVHLQTLNFGNIQKWSYIKTYFELFYTPGCSRSRNNQNTRNSPLKLTLWYDFKTHHWNSPYKISKLTTKTHNWNSPYDMISKLITKLTTRRQFPSFPQQSKFSKLSQNFNTFLKQKVDIIHELFHPAIVFPFKLNIVYSKTSSAY